MKIISHRGCLTGPDLINENTQKQVNRAVNAGFDVEVDVWVINDKLYLGHDMPRHEVDLPYLTNPKLWCHAKNYKALELLLPRAHVFWHQRDDLTLTSKGIPWCYPGVYVPGGITVETGIPRKIEHISGVCVDNPLEWLKI